MTYILLMVVLFYNFTYKACLCITLKQKDKEIRIFKRFIPLTVILIGQLSGPLINIHLSQKL